MTYCCCAIAVKLITVVICSHQPLAMSVTLEGRHGTVQLVLSTATKISIAVIRPLACEVHRHELAGIFANYLYCISPFLYSH